jgi:UDP-N-acetylmuramate dehydrogenase
LKTAIETSLREFNTLGVAEAAASLATIEQLADLGAIHFDPSQDLVLGGGSNVLLVGGVPGTVYLNRLQGRSVIEQGKDHVVVEIAAGEPWHELVLWTLASGYSGLENLSLIPGLTGAAPMQNIGAYGVELSDRLVSLVVWDWQSGALVEFDNRDCSFGYRDSRFRSADPGRYLITAIRLRLDLQFQPVLDYAGLREELDGLHIKRPDARQVSKAVVRIRQRKLPDPLQIGNAGSFFKNPLVDKDSAEALRTHFPGLPAYLAGPGQTKLSAAWMLEYCGWKGHRSGDAGFSERHALVLVNHGSASGSELMELAEQAAVSVNETFGVLLEPEPRIIGRSWAIPTAQQHQ